jgi:outer membrane protein assembly factor BamB
MKISHLGLIAALCALAACHGGGPTPSGCTSSDQCTGGLVCVVPGSGAGTCTAAPFSVQLAAPAQGADIGPAGVAVQAVVTKADASGPAPISVALVVDRAEAADMALDSQDGATLRYRATYVPPAGVVRSAIIAAVAKTSGGSIASPGAIVALDTKPPVIDQPVASCGPAAIARGACLRDDSIDVSVSVTDDHPVTVTASLDLPGPATALPFTGPPAFHEALVNLGQHAFPAFTGSATVTVTATDSVGNTATLTMQPVKVTRLRWVYDAGAVGVSSPALRSDGTPVVTVNATSAQLRAIQPANGTEAWRATLGTQAFASAPSLGALVYAGSSDGELYARDPSTGARAVTCPSATPPTGALFTPAVLLTPETAFTAGAAAGLYGAKPGAPASCLATASTTDPVTTSPVISGQKVFAATAQAHSTVRRFPSSGPEEASAATGCGSINVPIAVDGAGTIVAACSTGEILSLDPATLAPSTRIALPSPPVESPVIFPNGDLLIGTNDRKLHRLTPPAGGTGAWIDAWIPVPDLNAAVTGQAIVTRDAAGVVAYAVTAGGHLHAVDGSGKTAWTTATEVTPPLGSVALSFPTIAPAATATALPTLYAGSADGKLYAVVVDSGLDPASPWPKSHHDVRNTGDAAAPLP